MSTRPTAIRQPLPKEIPSGEVEPKKRWLASLSSPSSAKAKGAFDKLSAAQAPSLMNESLYAHLNREALAAPAFLTEPASIQNAPWKQPRSERANPFTVEQEVIEEGAATARVVSGVLDAVGSIAFLPVRAAAIGHYESFEVRPYMQPTPSPVLEAIGAAIQRALPSSLKEAPQRFERLHGIDPQNTATFVGDVVGIAMMAAGARVGGACNCIS